MLTKITQSSYRLVIFEQLKVTNRIEVKQLSGNKRAVIYLTRSTTRQASTGGESKVIPQHSAARNL